MDFRERIQKWRDELVRELEDMKKSCYGFSLPGEADYQDGKKTQLGSIIEQLNDILKDTNTKEEEK